MPVRVLSARNSMQIQNGVNAMLCTDIYHAVEMSKPFVIQFKWIELLGVIEEMTVIEWDPQSIETVLLEESSIGLREEIVKKLWSAMTMKLAHRFKKYVVFLPAKYIQ